MPDNSAGLWSLSEWKHYCTDAMCAFKEHYPSAPRTLEGGILACLQRADEGPALFSDTLVADSGPTG